MLLQFAFFLPVEVQGGLIFFFFFSSRRRHTRWNCDWSSDVCSSDLLAGVSHNDVQFRRGGIKHETSGIFALDVNAGDQRTGVHIDDFDGAFGTGVWSRVRAVAKVKEMSGWIVD